tara:strand:+ start:1056 stop:1724 length:669 start_codon:yes stop_codon:yes gene_type:complete
MLKKYSSYLLVINMIYHHFIFFKWYLSDQQMQIERAFSLGLIAFLSAIIFILYIHICFFPKKAANAAHIPTFPPLIMLFSLSLGFLIGISNLYVLQLYELPQFFDIFRSNVLGISVIILSFILINFSIKIFIDNDEDPNPTTQSNVLITDGIYAYIRNPMYLALTLFQIGVGISLSFIHISIMAILTVILLHYFVILREEKYLLKLFGEDYKLYLKKSRRWV